MSSKEKKVPDLILECGVFVFYPPKPHVKESLVNGGLYPALKY